MKIPQHSRWRVVTCMIILCLILVGCERNYSDLQNFIKEVNARPAQALVPLLEPPRTSPIEPPVINRDPFE